MNAMILVSLVMDQGILRALLVIYRNTWSVEVVLGVMNLV